MRTIKFTGGMLPTIDDPLLAEARQGKVEIVWLNQTLDLRLNKDEERRFGEAIRKGFAVLPVSGRRLNMADVWLHHCENNRIPYVYVRPTPKSALVKMDLISLGHLNQEGLRNAWGVLKSYTITKPRFGPNSVIMEVKTKLEDAELVASLWRDIALEFTER